LDKAVCYASNSHLLLLEDFNYPAINYSTFMVNPVTDYEQLHTYLL